ncbi:MAG TPA: hypothetical protein VIM14_10485 [Polyangia bacterium]
MRTTLTLDTGVVATLAAETHRQRRPYKQVAFSPATLDKSTGMRSLGQGRKPG